MTGFDIQSLPLVAVGLGMIALGVLIPGTQPTAVTSLVVGGTALTVVGVLSPIYREMEFGPTKLRLARKEDDVPQPWMLAEGETLNVIARLVLGNSELARNTVEDTLSRVRRFSRRIPANSRELTKLKTLAARLESANQQLWDERKNKRRDPEPESMLAVLQRLDFSVRMAFALRREFPVREVAEVLGRTEGEVNADVERAQTALELYAKDRGADV